MMSSLESSAASSTALRRGANTGAVWSLGHRIWFRFVFVYVVLYSLVDILAPRSMILVPGLSHVVIAHARLWHAIPPWVGTHLLHLGQTITDRPATGFAGGDTTFHYVRLLCYVVTAALATTVWSVVDTRGTDYAKLDDWLRTFLRYTLALTMLVFGSGKVIKVQFPDPSLMRLIQPLGDFEPTALMWAFIGASTSYTLFSGAAEVLGGLLLFFRQTATLGALVILTVMLNVVAMNLSYDVPVKLLALHQLIICVLLIVPDLGRLLSVFVLNRPVAPAAMNPPVSTRWAVNALRLTKAVVIGYAVLASVNMALRVHRSRAVKPPLYGIWQVEEFARNDETLPPLLTDTNRWRQVIVYSRAPGGLAVKSMDDKVTAYSMAYDRDRNTLTISPVPGQRRKDVLNVLRLEPDRVVLHGHVGNDALSMTLRRIDDSRFPLLRKGFHWINDGPWVPE